MNADRKAEKAQYAEFNVPTCTGADAEASLLRTKLIYSVLPHMEMNTVCLEKLSHGNRQMYTLDTRFSQG